MAVVGIAGMHEARLYMAIDQIDIFNDTIETVNIVATNLNLLVSLQALLLERNVTQAAQVCAVTQSTMSYSLRKLRELFDDPLLVRTDRGLELTPLAEGLVGPLDSGLHDLQRVLAFRTSFDPAHTRRTFRIASSDALQIISLDRLLARFSSEAPNANLTIRPEGSATPEALASGAVDVAVRASADAPGPGLEAQEMFREGFVCAVAKAHPSVGRRITLAKYARLGHVLVASDEGPGLVDRILEQHGRQRRVVLRIPDYAGVGHIVASSELVATLPQRLAARLADSLPLRLLPPPVPVRSFGVSLFWHRRYTQDPGGIWLRRLLVELAPL